VHAVVLALLLVVARAPAAEWKAGVARKVITPSGPIWMSGYAARTQPSEGVIHDLWAKALALQDPGGGRVVIVTADLIGLPREVSEEVAARVKQQHGLERSHLVLNASHTHYGPVVWPGLRAMCEHLPPADQERLVEYRKQLTDNLVALVGAALADLGPAALAVGHGSAEFPANRRQPTDKGVRLGFDPKGPVDHDVPVLTVAAPDGKLRAVLFGLACHNTTVAANYYLIHGDYAGFAQVELEQALPGTTAMFLALCGGDQNPHPRGTWGISAEYGLALAQAVQRVLAAPRKPVRPPIRTAYDEVKLEFAPQERATYEQEAKSPDRFRKRRAETMLAALDAGHPIQHTRLPVQVVRWGEDLALVALGGEVVVDYALRLKRECPGTDLVVAGYTNDVPCYVPTRRVLSEKGYEPVESMIYYGLPGPLAESVEETIIQACRRLLDETKAGASRR
jgi:hypothetical protein